MEQGIFKELKEADCGMEIGAGNRQSWEDPQDLFLKGYVSHRTLDINWKQHRTAVGF